MQVQNSGSSVRPTKMLEAFRSSGYEVLLLSGLQTRQDRIQRVKKVRTLIESKRPDLCYVESPTHAIFRRCDRHLIREIHQMGIPIAYFYRDFYNKFRDLFPRRKGVIPYLRDLYWDYLVKRTDNVLKYCDIVYLPSEEAKSLFHFTDMRPLPPAGEEGLIQSRIPNHTCIYVGGVMGPYNCSLLLETMNLLYQEDNSYRLILVTREKVWNKYQHPLKYAPWLEVHHVSADRLASLYQRAALGFVIPREDFSYNSFAVSVKLFEYMSYGLPVVALNTAALSNIVANEGIGLVANSSRKEVAAKVKQLLTDQTMYKNVCNNIKVSLLEKNLWKHRVETVVTDLINKRK